MNFREFLKINCNEEVIRKDKGYCELELKDGKYVINCTKSTFSLSKDEIDELSKMISEIK